MRASIIVALFSAAVAPAMADSQSQDGLLVPRTVSCPRNSCYLAVGKYEALVDKLFCKKCLAGGVCGLPGILKKFTHSAIKVACGCLHPAPPKTPKTTMMTMAKTTTAQVTVPTTILPPPPPPPPMCNVMFVNEGFESGAIDPWTGTAETVDGRTNVATDKNIGRPGFFSHTGDYFLKLGDFAGSSTTFRVCQDVMLLTGQAYTVGTFLGNPSGTPHVADVNFFLGDDGSVPQTLGQPNMYIQYQATIIYTGASGMAPVCYVVNSVRDVPNASALTYLMDDNSIMCA